MLILCIPSIVTDLPFLQTILLFLLFTNREDGYVYDKEVILEYVLKRKQEIEKQMKEYKKR